MKKMVVIVMAVIMAVMMTGCGKENIATIQKAAIKLNETENIIEENIETENIIEENVILETLMN